MISVKPSLVLIALGAACLAWRFVGIGGPSTTARWLTPRASGMIGLLMLGFGFVVWWMEAAGFRDAPVVPRKSTARIAPTAQKYAVNRLAEENLDEELSG